ncbi:hypothetical protein E1952_14950 [Staphylococcus aureus]|nr:hypothetical protein E1952_14950 [Staphylococcus aureus]
MVRDLLTTSNVLQSFSPQSPSLWLWDSTLLSSTSSSSTSSTVLSSSAYGGARKTRKAKRVSSEEAATTETSKRPKPAEKTPAESAAEVEAQPKQAGTTEQTLWKAQRRPRRNFTDEEDEALLRGFREQGPSWVSICKDEVFREHGRTPTDLRDRLRTRFPEKYAQAGLASRPAVPKPAKRTRATRGDRVPHIDMTKLKLPQDCDGEVCMDNVLLYKLNDYINSLKDDGVIVLHQMGSHGPAYYRRSTPQFQTFSPTCNSNQIQDCSHEQLVNTYDNSILYTDAMLDATIKLLQQYDDRFNTALVYLSDHGESLGENGMYLHGTPYAHIWNYLQGSDCAREVQQRLDPTIDVEKESKHFEKEADGTEDTQDDLRREHRLGRQILLVEPGNLKDDHE